jgi:hypothetical protein
MTSDRIATLPPSRGAGVRSLGVQPCGQQRIKIYLMPGTDEGAAREAVRIATGQGVVSALTLGYAIVSAGDTGPYVLLGLWVGENGATLLERCFIAEREAHCPWVLSLDEALVRGFEAAAFSASPDGEAYLSRWFADAIPERLKRSAIDGFAAAWSRVDIDGLMHHMAEEPAYHTSGGTRFEGTAAVRRGLTGMCQPSPASFSTPEAGEAPPVHFFDDKSLSYWTLPLPGLDGTSVMVRGVDVITYDPAGRILLKDAYRKMV